MNGAFHPMQPIQEMEDYKSVLTGEDSGGSDVNDDQEDEEDTPVNESLLDVAVIRPHEKTRFVTVHVIVASLLAALGGVLFGYDVGIVSGALLQLTRDFSLTCRQQEMVVSSMLLGALIASFTGGFLVDHFGRRKSIICNSVVFIVGAVTLTCAQNFPTLVLSMWYLQVVGRLIVGFGVSLSAIAECVYITEISPANQRGLLVSLNELGITCGFLTAYLVNFAFIKTPDGWRYMFGLSMVPALLQGIGMTFLPPSPRFLMIRRREDEARVTLVKLRGTEDVDDEIRSMRESLGSQKTGSIFDLCGPEENMAFRFIMGLGLVFFQQFTGQPSVLYYAPTIFLSLGFDTDSAAMVATVGLGVVKVLFTTVALLCVDCAGRRKFLLVGTLMMLVGIACLSFTALSTMPGVVTSNCQPTEQGRWELSNSTDLKLLPLDGLMQGPGRMRRDHGLAFPLRITATNHTVIEDSVTPAVKWLSFMALVLYTAGYAVGFGPVSWLVLSEIFPSRIRGRAISLATVANWGTNLVVSFTFLDLLNVLSLSGTFLLYAASGALALLYIYFLVPETKGRTLEDISAHLNQSYLAVDPPCCQRRRVSRLRLAEDDLDLEDNRESSSQDMRYSLLASQ